MMHPLTLTDLFMNTDCKEEFFHVFIFLTLQQHVIVTSITIIKLQDCLKYPLCSFMLHQGDVELSFQKSVFLTFETCRRKQ
jgi:hypothetical protein